MGVLDRFRPRIGASEIAGVFRGRVEALRSMEESPGSFGEMLGRWGVSEDDSDALTAGLRKRAGAFLAAGAAFSLPLAAGGSDVLWALPMVPAVLGASLDAWRADMLAHRRWRTFVSYLAGFMLPGGGWGPEEGACGAARADACGLARGGDWGQGGLKPQAGRAPGRACGTGGSMPADGGPEPVIHGPHFPEECLGGITGRVNCSGAVGGAGPLSGSGFAACSIRRQDLVPGSVLDIDFRQDFGCDSVLDIDFRQDFGCDSVLDIDFSRDFYHDSKSGITFRPDIVSGNLSDTDSQLDSYTDTLCGKELLADVCSGNLSNTVSKLYSCSYSLSGTDFRHDLCSATLSDINPRLGHSSVAVSSTRLRPESATLNGCRTRPGTGSGSHACSEPVSRQNSLTGMPGAGPKIKETTS